METKQHTDKGAHKGGSLARGCGGECSFINRRSFSTMEVAKMRRYSASGFTYNDQHSDGQNSIILASLENPGEFYEFHYAEHKAKHECSCCHEWFRGYFRVKGSRFSGEICPICQARFTQSGKFDVDSLLVFVR